MKRNEPVSNIMSDKITAVQEGQPLSEVRHKMIDSNIHHIPVLSGKNLVGMVSFTDMMKLNVVINGADNHTIDAIIDQQFSIGDIMSTELTTLNDRDTIRQAAEILSGNNFHAVPVTNSNRELQGIVTSSDLIRYLNNQY
ncbi:MAG: CBS domain-containing protein [Gammaproteobacteria bacterium]|nr:MAG: CBS domain-containing protein [Gammaproteobacteria bacterium]